MNHSDEPVDPVLAKVRPLFLKRLPTYAEEIRDAVSRRDRESLKRSSHTLKGTAANFGYPALADVAARLEEAAEGATSPLDWQPLVGELTVLCDDLRRAGGL